MRTRPASGLLCAHKGPLVVAAAVTGALLAGCGGDAGARTVASAREARGPAVAGPVGTPSAAAPTPGADPLLRFRSVRARTQVAAPVRLRIPAIGVTTSLERLGVAADRTVAVPLHPGEAGWYIGGPRPGQDGPAVVLGHVDSRDGPAVFFRLHELRPGDPVLVDRADGSTVRFRVTASASYPKRRFPTASVYYPTLRPELRLITCGGTIDPRTGHYRDNLIVSASLA